MITDDHPFHSWKLGPYALTNTLWTVDSDGLTIPLYNDDWSLWWEASKKSSTVYMMGLMQAVGNKPGVDPRFIPRENLFETEAAAMESLCDSGREIEI